MRTITDLAYAINDNMDSYKISELQDIRKRIHKLHHTKTQFIFQDESIFEDGGYAFHLGGRKEIQFNIGKDEDKFRHGLAFSLKKTQGMRDISIFKRRIELFNEYFREDDNRHSDMHMWYFGEREDGSRSRFDIDGYFIEDRLYAPDNFIFLGKRYETSEINVQAILKDFDQLLPLYKYIEERVSYVNQPTVLANKISSWPF